LLHKGCQSRNSPYNIKMKANCNFGSDIDQIRKWYTSNTDAIICCSN